MMLDRKTDIIENLKKTDDLFSSHNVQCWSKPESNFEIYIFSIELEDEYELSNIWEDMTNLIATHFQPELEKDVEAWNLYLVFIVESEVSKELKYLIEQDKYSTRKIVFDTIKDKSNIPNLISKKLFEIDCQVIKAKDFPQKSVEELLESEDHQLCELLKKEEFNPKEILQKYLEVF